MDIEYKVDPRIRKAGGSGVAADIVYTRNAANNKRDLYLA
jgi:hypothetical protein